MVEIWEFLSAFEVVDKLMKLRSLCMFKYQAGVVNNYT